VFKHVDSVEIYRKQPPNATQISPANGVTLPSTTTEFDLSFQGGDVFTVHVWDLTTNYEMLQGDIRTTTFHITGLQAGATYNWQVLGANDQGAGQWSTIWTFSVASQSNPTPNPTEQPTSQPSPSPTAHATISLDSIGLPGCNNVLAFTLHGLDQDHPVDFIDVKQNGVDVVTATVYWNPIQYTYTYTVPLPQG
jgi:hypothetical protein